MDETKEVRQIPIEEIIPNRFQPRINFDEKSLEELSNSIKQHGIIQPLVLRPLGDKFEIIAGERRYKAATIAGLATVPAIVTEMDDGTSAEVALIENVQRKDLSSIEEAKSYKNMLDRSNMTQEELAKKMGLSQSTIANKLRLLNLSEEVQNALMQEKISERHARALLAISDKNEQKQWLDRIINERLTVRQLDLAIKDEMNEKKQISPIDGDVPIVDINPDIDSIINNAVDINPVETKKDINFFDGTTNELKNEENNEESSSEPIVPGDNSESSQKKNTMPNKFFNFLEDQEVNMNMTEEPKKEEVKEEKSESESKPNGVFSFSPEFADAPENKFEAEEIDSLDVPEENKVEEVPDNTPIFDINAPENGGPVDNNVEELLTEEPIQENVVNFEPDQQPGVQEPTPEFISSPEQIVESPVVEANLQVEQPVQENNISSDFIFDEDEELLDETPVSKNQVIEEPTPEVAESNDFVAEPIPIMQGEGIVDPVAYYDTLDPGFVEKLRETAGLDLKTAINTYRDITTVLNEKGFNISIDEADMGGSYRIQIDISEE